MLENVVNEQTAITEEQVQQESSDAFEAGFNQERGEPTTETSPEPVQEEVKAEEPEAPQEQTEEVKEVDPWEGVPQVVREKLEAVTGKLGSVDKISDRIRNIEGHIGGLASQVKSFVNASKAVAKAGVETPSQAQIETAAQSSEKWKAIKEDYPDWAEALEERLAEEKRAAPVDLEGFQKKVDESVGSLNSTLRAELRRAHETIVEIKHPDWRKDVNTNEFKNWFNGQTNEMKALAASESAVDAIKLLDVYKSSTKKSKQDKEQRLRSAVTPQGSAAKPNSINDDDAFERGFASARGI